MPLSESIKLLENIEQESCAISKMTARCALYKYIVSRCGDVAIRNYPCIRCHLEFIRIENSAIRRPRKPHAITKHEVDRTTGCGLRRYGHLKFFQDGGGRHLGPVRTGNGAIRSAVHENPNIEQNMTWIGQPVAEISPLEIFPTLRWPPYWICSNRK